MSVIVCRPAAQFCSTCYRDHDGDNCPSDRSTVNVLDASRDGVTVIAASETEPTTREEEEDPTMTTESTTPAQASETVTASCPAPEDAAAKAVREAIEGATAPLKAELGEALADRDVARCQDRAKSRTIRDLQDRLGRAELDMLGAAGLLLESACLVQDLSVENTFQRTALEIADVALGELTAANAALREALTAGHCFARLAYSDPSTPRSLRGEAAIAIVQISDAVTGR